MRPLFKTIATSAFLLLPHTSGLPNEHQIPQTNCPQTTITQAENFSEEVLPSLQTLQQETQQHVYLTIDDGPGKYTQKIIEALDSLGHKATFFFIGENIKEQQRKTLLQLLNSGHEIGNHSYSHPNFKKISTAQAKREVEKTEEKLEDMNITPSSYFRYPGGNEAKQNTDFLNFLKNKGYTTIPRDIDTRDWDRKTTKADLIRRLEKVKPGDVILIHERGRTVPQTILVVDSILQSKNLISVPLSEKSQ